MNYKEILKGIVNIINTTEKSDIGFTNICTYIGENCPELRKSEDEKVRKALINIFATHKDYEMFFGASVEDIRAWLEKQKSEEINVKALLTADRLAAAEMTGRLKERKDIVENPQKYGLEKQCKTTAKSKSEEELSDFEAALFSAFSDGWQQYLHGEEVDVAQWAKEHSAELLEAAKQDHAAWSEKDELHISELESLVKQVWTIAEHENDKETIYKMSNLSFFLKTLKPQLKQEWSEEDERAFHHVLSVIEEYGKEHPSKSKFVCNWLKSIKARMGGDKV